MSHTIPAAIVRAVDRRDEAIDRSTGHFIGLGRNLHHRQLLSRGGKDIVSNLITLSGSGTTGSHGWMHHNVAEATRLGFIIPSRLDPDTVPIKYADDRGRKQWVLLLDSGEIRPITDAIAERTMRDLGIWKDEALF